MKKLFLIFFLGVIVTILIYVFTNKNENNFLVLGDSVASGETNYGNLGISFNLYLREYLSNKNLGKYDTNYTSIYYTVEKLMDDIEKNNLLKNIHLQKRIKNSEVIIIAVGQDELNILQEKNLLNNINRRNFIVKYNELIKLIRKITTNQILMINYFGNLNQINWLNNQLRIIAENYGCQLIDINLLIKKEHFFTSDKNHLNYLGQQVIFSQIIRELSL